MKRSYLKPEMSKPTGGPVPLHNCLTNSTERDLALCRVHDLIRSFIVGPAFSCVVGKRAIARGLYRLGVYASMADIDCVVGLTRDIWQFVADQPGIKGPDPDDYSTFLAVFLDPVPATELDFETSLWKLLQDVHDEDSKHYVWDPAVQSDPSDPGFSFSVGSQAFFLVGMHEQSSRISRRFVYPAIAFNSHHQFEDLRARGEFVRVQHIIRSREIKIQGDINPNLANFGSDSEAKQYSGRPVEPAWKCPFHQ